MKDKSDGRYAGTACWKHAISITPLKRSAEWDTATTYPPCVSKTRDKITEITCLS